MIINVMENDILVLCILVVILCCFDLISRMNIFTCVSLLLMCYFFGELIIEITIINLLCLTLLLILLMNIRSDIKI